MTLFLTGLLAGILDAIAAVLLFMTRGNKDPRLLFRYIASAAYGKDAFTKGSYMVYRGLLFHFIIAMTWVTIYFILFAHLSWLTSHPLPAAIGYGILVWVLMNFIIVPASKAAPRPFSYLFALINILILIATIGLPAAYLL